jgi:hypothetical protein
MRSSSSFLVLFVGASLFGSAAAQSAADLIDLDRQIALERRKQELQRLRDANRPPAPPPAPLVASEKQRSVDDDFRVIAVYGPTNALRALVSYRSDPPVELSMAGVREVGGWRLMSLNTQSIELQQIGSAQQRAFLPMRFSAPPATPTMAATTPSGPTSYLPMPLPAAVTPSVFAPPPSALQVPPSPAAGQLSSSMPRPSVQPSTVPPR